MKDLLPVFGASSTIWKKTSFDYCRKMLTVKRWTTLVVNQIKEGFKN